jgi:hypothetical protein
MATLSHHQKHTVNQSASPSDTFDQDTNTRSHPPSQTTTPRSSPPLQPPAPPVDATINPSIVSANTNAGSRSASGSGPPPGTNTPVYVPYHPQQGHHRHTSSVSRLNNRSSTGLFALAASAFDRTQNAIAAISEPSVRPRQSSGALSRLSLLTSSSPSSEPSSPDKYHRLRSSSNQSLSSGATVDGKIAPQALQANNPPSQPYATTDPNHPLPYKSSTAVRIRRRLRNSRCMPTW